MFLWPFVIFKWTVIILDFYNLFVTSKQWFFFQFFKGLLAKINSAHIAKISIN